MLRIAMELQIGGVVMASSLLMVLSGCTAQSHHGDKPHHTENGFRNIGGPPAKGFLDFLKWRWERRGKSIKAREEYHFPIARNDPAFLRSNRTEHTVTWIGHATLLVQIEGYNILTDPHFSQRASPVQWAGPQRVVAPGLSLERLPPIDVVVISHDHYDSLDTGTIAALHQRPNGKNTTFFVPLGLKSWFESLGVSRVIELDWWNSYKLNELEIVAVPAHHWSKRGLFGRNQTLWAGWVVRSPTFSFYFAGDSGYSDQFKEIGKRLGPFQLSAIPIGAYEPRWFMRAHHMNPEEAVKVHMDVRSRKSVGIHWGTFLLTDEPLDEPAKKLELAKEAYGLAVDSFVALKHGETVRLTDGRSR